MKTLRAATAAWLLLTATAVAGPYTDLYVFGDSLSDVGNDSLFTLSAVPGPSYFEGRFSNGPVYSELLAQGLGLGPLVRSGSSGNGYAYGGALTSGTSFPTSLVVDDLDDQIDDYLDNRTVDADALYTVLIGANDFFGGQTNVLTPAGRVANDLDRLADAGVENFLVLNLPELGLTPRYNGSVSGDSSQAGAFNQLARSYNAALAGVLDDLETDYPDANVFRLDVAGLLNDLIDAGAARGFTNTTDPAAPGLEAGDLFYDESQIVDDPDAYLFWDDVHPTAALHRLLSFEAIRAVLPAGDYNRDGDVTLADYTVWRETFGSTTDLAADGDSSGHVDASDYALWRENVSPAAPMFQHTPEPASCWLLAGLLVVPLRRRR